MSLPFGPPVHVSPLIRGIRFALLVAGIFYARGKQVLYNSMEASYREEQARKKIIRDKELAILKAKIADEEREAVRLLQTGKLFDPDAWDGYVPGGGGGGGGAGGGGGGGGAGGGACPPPKPPPPVC